jgi:hypothetical protein
MSRRVQILVPKELDARIEKATQRSKMSKEAWVRRAIKQALQHPSEGSRNIHAVARLASLDAPTADIEQMIAEIASGRS